MEKIIAKREVYVIGNAEVSLGAGFKKECKTPFISIARIEQQPKIGFDLLKNPVEEIDLVVLYFKNLEGLAVLEKCIKNTKRILKEQQNLLK